ncbi:hypothetical protein ES703_116144 [subsurface metagenome]
MRMFIKRGARDKLISLEGYGGGFQEIEVMVTDKFELMVPEPERKDWIELYPSWEEKTLHLNGLELGILTGLIMQALPQTQNLLHRVWKQLMTIKKVIEEEAGVTKEILPGGLIQMRDRDGNVITREPLPHEIEGN